MMETIAIYWEPVIKTYGIFVRDDLVLWSLTLAQGQTVPDLPVDAAAPELELVAAQPLNDGRMRLHLVLNTVPQTPSWVDAVETGCDEFRRIAPVTMLFCQGPHFGDRYGIAHAATSALTRREVTILAAACTAASLHFVVPQVQAIRAHQALSQAFVVPPTPNRTTST